MDHKDHMSQGNIQTRENVADSTVFKTTLKWGAGQEKNVMLTPKLGKEGEIQWQLLILPTSGVSV